MFVFIKAKAASEFAPNALPALKPNHPTHKSAAPATTKGTLCGVFDLLHLFPYMIAATKAAVPELR